MLRLSLLFALVLSLAACAGNNRFVLLEEDDGRVGAITVENAGGSQTIDEASAGVRVASAGDAPGTPETVPEEDIRQTWGAALDASPLQPRSFLLYFVFGTDVLTGASRSQLPAILTSLGRYPAPEVAVIGHTDRVGPADVNERLARERAEAMYEVLIRAGLDPALISVSSHGEANPLIPTADEVPEPRNRRVEVTVR